MIVLKINNELTRQLQQLIQRLENRQPLMREIAGIMEFAVQENFRQGGRPKWLGLKYREGQPLQLSGRLAASITEYSDNEQSAVGTNVVYAAIHNFGGETKPHIIRPRYKKALKFNGRYAKQVNHPGSKIPAREFLSLTVDDETEILYATNQYLRKVLD